MSLPRACQTSPKQYSLYNYENKEVRQLIKYLKNHKDEYLYKVLSQIMYEHIIEAFQKESAFHPKDTWVVLGVPMSSKRRSERGFNQTELLAKKLGKNLAIKMIHPNTVTKRDTKKQALLERAQRTKNITNAFTVTKKALVKNKNIIIVDDLITTGATCRELSKTLIQAGVYKTIWVSIAH